MGGICKSISIVLFNLCFIGSFILAFKFEAGRWIIYGLIAGFISFLPIYIWGEIAEQLEKSNKNTFGFSCNNYVFQRIFCGEPCFCNGTAECRSS